MIMAKEISTLLSQRALEIARYLLPNGKKDGNEWRVGSVEGQAGSSLGVHLTGKKAGVWCDFSSPNDSGDLLDLWCAVRNVSLGIAINEAASYLGCVFRPQPNTDSGNIRTLIPALSEH